MAAADNTLQRVQIKPCSDIKLQNAPSITQNQMRAEQNTKRLLNQREIFVANLSQSDRHFEVV